MRSANLNLASFHFNSERRSHFSAKTYFWLRCQENIDARVFKQLSPLGPLKMEKVIF